MWPRDILRYYQKNAIGVDVAHNQIKYAKKYSSKKVKFLTYKNKLPIKSQSIESISMIELIEHMDKRDLNYLLKECKRVLKKMVISIYLRPIIFFVAFTELILNQISPVNYKHEHINKFNKRRLAEVMKKNGFEIVQLESFILLSPFLALISFNFSKLMIFFDNLITKFFPGFLLFCKLKKKNVE